MCIFFRSLMALRNYLTIYTFYVVDLFDHFSRRQQTNKNFLFHSFIPVFFANHINRFNIMLIYKASLNILLLFPAFSLKFPTTINKLLGVKSSDEFFIQLL